MKRYAIALVMSLFVMPCNGNKKSPENVKADIDQIINNIAATETYKEGHLRKEFGVTNVSGFLIREIGEAIGKTTQLLETYSIFNPYKYILQNKINHLHQLQMMATSLSKSKNPEFRARIIVALRSLVDSI